MKNILVPTDFSENAASAYLYAIELAKRFNATVTVVHVYHPSINTPNEMMIVSNETFRRINKERLSKFVLNDQIIGKEDIMLDNMVKQKIVLGFVVDKIVELSKNGEYDLIVMGTQGASGLKELFLGSKTSAVMQKTETPILAIPNNFKYRLIKEIAFAVDSGVVADGDVLSPLLKIAKSCKSNIKVMHLVTDKMVVGYDPGIDISLEEVPHTFHKFSGSNEVNEIVNLFVSEENADMICMIRRGRGFWENLFHKSVTRKEIFNSPVPLLVLHK